jgi:nicotinic acid phosphoribosyltransferase
VSRMKSAAAMSVVLQKRYKCKADKKALAKEGGAEQALAYLEALAVEAGAILYLAMLNMAKKNFVRFAKSNG